MSITLTDAERAAIGLANDPDCVTKAAIERVIEARIEGALAPIRDLAGERGNDEALDAVLDELDAEPQPCAVCSEPIIGAGVRWTHRHGDTYCGTGDGAVATPREGE